MALPAVIGGWVVKWFAAGVGVIAARAMVALGIGYATYTFAVPSATALFSSFFGGIPAEVRAVIAMCQVDVAITMILSAIAAKLAMRMVWRRV